MSQSTLSQTPTFQSVLDFWFSEIEPAQWWQKSLEFDQMIERRFGALHQQATQGELFEWRSTPQGALAEILVLDQFSRNIYRDKPQSFASDAQALTLAQVAVDRGFAQQLTSTQQSFLYMPYMHSESFLVHEQAVKLFEALGNEYNLDFELKHKAIIDRFGRYPHRNTILNRKSSQEELEFLAGPNSSF
jgi:uncharacterized protein (DUF924 family)